MEEKKKNNRGFIITIVALVIIVFGLIFYILYDKGIILNAQDKNGMVEKTNEKKDKVENLSNKEKELLIEKINVINNFSKYYPLIDVNKIDNQELLFKLASEIGFGKSFSEKSMTEKIKSYFGDSYNIKHEDIICSFDNEPFYVYSSDTNMYRYDVNSVHGHGGAGGIREIVVNYVDGTITNNKEIVVNTKLLYSTYCGDTCGPNYAYYASYQDVFDNKPILSVDDNSEEEIKLTDELYKSVEDKLPTTTFKFTKKDKDTYNLESVTIK